MMEVKNIGLFVTIIAIFIVGVVGAPSSSYGMGAEESVQCSASESNKQQSYVGIASMDAENVLTYYLIGKFIGQKKDLVVIVYKPDSPGYAGAIANIGGIKPGEKKPIPASQPSSGSISMDANRNIIVTLWTLPTDGVTGSMKIKIKPGDPRYASTIASVCGLYPGQTKTLPSNAK